MPQVVKYFLLGMNKTLDIGNNSFIYEIDTKSNIRKSWEDVGSVLEKRISKGLKNEQRNSSNRSRARIN